MGKNVASLELEFYIKLFKRHTKEFIFVDKFFDLYVYILKTIIDGI